MRANILGRFEPCILDEKYAKGSKMLRKNTMDIKANF